MTERERLEQRIRVLDAKLLMLSSQLVEAEDKLAASEQRVAELEAAASQHGRDLRDVYRRGWMTGYQAGCRRAPVDPEPELRTRGRVRRLLTNAEQGAA